MKSDSRAVFWVVWGFLLLIMISVAGVYFATLLRRPAPPLPVYGQLPEFRLTNQLDHALTLADLEGRVCIADIIFTRCPGPCLGMTRKMQAIQAALPPGSPVTLLSLTADPAYDTPAVLKQYAARCKADSANWQFLTGPKAEVYRVAIHGLKLAVQENTDGKPDENQFIHSTRFVLIDRHGRLRGIALDGTEEATVPDILRCVRELLKESGS